MAGSKSDYLENKVLDHVFGSTSYAKPATVYLGLYTSLPSDAGGGVECVGGDYARVAITNSDTNWPAASAGQKSNGTPITFPTAIASWGTVVGFGIFDDPAAGNLLYWGPLGANKSVDIGDTPNFGVGDIVITED